ncbi:hypothetical protein J7E62_12340 [Variovorax paradoxus]|nr:hypothetical protein [Variovorax paradoxus]
MTKKKDTPPPTRKKSALLNVVVEPGKTADRQCAEMAAQGLVRNAATLVNFSLGGIGELSLNDCLTVLRERGDAMNRGDMRDHEAMLSAQAVALNAVFGELAALNMGEHLGATETYLRLAMKAQSQCRTTVETLAEMKNPPVVFARQANISNGPQQVNNGVPASDVERSARAHARTGEKAITPTELLEDASNGRTQLDTRATPTTGRTDKTLEPVGAVHRAEH